MKYDIFEVFEVRLTADYHPVDYESEWVDKGTTIYASYMHGGDLYLSDRGRAGKPPNGAQGLIFMTDAQPNNYVII